MILAAVLSSDDPRISGQHRHVGDVVGRLERFDLRGQNESAHAAASAQELASAQLQLEVTPERAPGRSMLASTHGEPKRRSFHRHQLPCSAVRTRSTKASRSRSKRV